MESRWRDPHRPACDSTTPHIRSAATSPHVAVRPATPPVVRCHTDSLTRTRSHRIMHRAHAVSCMFHVPCTMSRSWSRCTPRFARLTMLFGVTLFL